MVAVSTDSLESHERFAKAIRRCPFPLACDEELEVARLYGVVGQDARRSHRAIFVIDQGGALLHQITWFQPGNIGQFMEIFQALGAVSESSFTVNVSAGKAAVLTITKGNGSSIFHVRQRPSTAGTAWGGGRCCWAAGLPLSSRRGGLCFEARLSCGNGVPFWYITWEWEP